MDKNHTAKIKKIENIFWKVVFIAYIALILYLSLSKPLINYSTFKGEDKIVHFISYFLGADLFFTAFYKKTKKAYFIILLISFALLPFITEWLQSFTYYRTYSKFDMLANYIGAVVGFLFFFLKHKAFSQE
ncbi:MAG TPA: VanZ family protein [Defluviitoga sp.]|nr:VanZ family protein [Defluviitoga sp.]HOP24608.1 VanZ family protein [Defluviitoga sp.]HPZ29416.1 VanZ family protein [Defluviitoga sp.]HQD63321.1 VanZ family protein [Defluviitoga sp.]